MQVHGIWAKKEKLLPGDSVEGCFSGVRVGQPKCLALATVEKNWRGEMECAKAREMKPSLFFRNNKKQENSNGQMHEFDCKYSPNN